MADRINGNYKIIESIQATDELEYVIGQNMNNLSQYVTWIYMRERDVYNGGEYCNSLLQARKNLLERALTAVNHAMPVSQPTVPENAISRDVHGERMSFELSGNEMDRIWDIVSQENIVIVYGMINRKMIAEDAQRHNCLFFGRDQDGTIKSCAVRGTGTVQFRGEVAGGNKSYSFAMNGSSNILRLFESPIDAMSHASFSKALGKDWAKDHRLSTNGCGYQSVLQYLTDHKDISKVWICYDNDQPGRKAADETAVKLRRDFPNRNLTVKIAYPQTKDWNEDLQQYRKLSEQSNISAADFVRGAAVQLQETPAAEPEAEEDEEDECMEM